jgi:hypothetical protein
MYTKLTSSSDPLTNTAYTPHPICRNRSQNTFLRRPRPRVLSDAVGPIGPDDLDLCMHVCSIGVLGSGEGSDEASGSYA